MNDPVRDIELLVRSRHGLIFVDSDEDERVASLLRHVADHLGIMLFTWSPTRGLRRDGLDNAIYGTAEPGQALAHLISSPAAAMYHFTGSATLLQHEKAIAQLREVGALYATGKGALIISGAGVAPPDAVRAMSATVSLPGPGLNDYKALLEHLVRDISRTNKLHVDLPRTDALRLLNSLKGLTLLEAEKVLTKAIVEDNKLTAEDIDHVVAAKKQIVEREGVLEYYPAEETMAQVADFVGLKSWIAKRSGVIHRPDQAARLGLDFPKGMLLIGVPGCGKSLCAKAVASEWKLPLLKLDPGALYNKYIGESEKNFKRACATAERLAPCVLFIDELEKAFASGGSEDGGVSQRVLGTFLSWLQERKGDVFTVATANDVSRLPPEFLRKGRFDEVFFVDLPDDDARAAILDIHLRRRNQDPAQFDRARILEACAGFSGAEIEQVVVSGLYTAFAADQALDTDVLLQEIAATRPLSVVMAEKIAALREWAQDRTVPAN